MLHIAHLSDTHLGYEAYRATDDTGRNQRGLDVVAAFHATVDAIVAADPDLVIHAGDLFDRTQVPVRYVLEARAGFRRLARRADGRARPVVVISGNHDQPRDRRERSLVELCDGIDGVLVVTDTWRRIALPQLPGVVVTAVPHDELCRLSRGGGWDQIAPVARTDVLVAHGIAGGSALYTRAQGREYGIPTEVLQRDWAYVALGHWHLRSPVGHAGHVWYAGSAENLGFGDARLCGDRHGYLDVTLTPEGRARVRPVDVPVRALVETAPFDGTGHDTSAVVAALAAQAAAVPAGSVLRQSVTGVTRDAWALATLDPLRHATAHLLHHTIHLTPPPAATSPHPGDGPEALDDLLVRLADQFDPATRDDILDAARACLARAEGELYE